MRRDCLNRELTTEVIVGAFMVMVLLGLGYFTIILSREAIFARRYTMDVVFDDVMGLRVGDSVIVRGMPVGKIESLVLDEQGSGVHAILSLDKDIRVRTDYKVTIVATSILGGRYLQIHEGTDGAPVLPDEVQLYGTRPYDLIKDASELVHAVRGSLVEGGALDNLKQVTADLRSLSGRLEGGRGTVGKLLSEDETLYSNLVETAASVRNIAARLEDGQGTLGKLMSEKDTLYDDLRASVASLRSIAERLEKGEGTLGKLMSSDAALYEDIRGAVGEARAAIDDMRETSPVVTFTSIFFGAL